MENKPLVTNINWGLILCVIALFTVGVVNLCSATGTRMGTGLAYSSFAQRQLLWGLLGVPLMVAAMSFDYHKLRTLAVPFYLVTLLLLVLVPLVGTSVNGSRRWISLGFMNLQPSELAKFAILLITARMLSQEEEPLGWKKFGKVMLVGMLPVALIVKQPDLGSGLMLLFVLGGMTLFHGLRARVFRPCLLAVPCVALFMWFAVMEEYQKNRIRIFLHPELDPRGSGWNISQSIIAVGSGQLWGKGYGEGTQSQLRFLPERHTDFASAVFGEEWGFVGCVALVTLFTLFFISIFSTIVQSKDRFGTILCVGVFFYFFCEIFINLGMVIGIMPVVGIPLPFISYGGSATIVNFLFLGIVLNVSMRRYAYKV